MDNRHATKLIQELERQNYELKQQNKCARVRSKSNITNNPDDNQFLIAIIIAIAGLAISPSIIKGE